MISSLKMAAEDPGESVPGGALAAESADVASSCSRVPRGAREPPTIDTEAASAGPENPGAGTPEGTRRQRTLDRTREAEAEKSYSETIREAEVHGEDWKEERRGRGARSLEQSAAAAPSPESPLTAHPSSPGVGTATASSPTGGDGVTTTSLRRVKELDAALSGAIVQECGVKVRAADTFRLIVPNRTASPSKEARLLIVPVSDSCLCEEPISEEMEPVPPAQAGEASGGAGASVPESPKATAAAASAASPEGGDGASTPPVAKGEDGGFVELELSFFRAEPKHSTMSKKMGAMPVVHVTLATSDGLCQSFEFLGVHQWQYYTQDPSLDAISQSLNESLLKVALEFIFHPSRTRYAKERLVLRECSSCPEGKRYRKRLLPLMAQEVQRANEKIRQVSVEYCASRTRARVKPRSMLVLDENVLLVSPAKTSTPKGALTGSRSKGKLHDPRAELPPAGGAASSAASAPRSSSGALPVTGGAAAVASASLASASATSPSGARTSPSGARTSPSGARTSPSGVASSLDGAALWEPPPGHRLPGALDADAGVTQGAAEFAKSAEHGFSKSAAADLAADDKETDEQETSLSELASQLFGDGADNESSNNAAEDGGEINGSAGSQPATGLRMLQQRRREREVKNKEQSDDLVQLWMKQRW